MLKRTIFTAYASILRFRYLCPALIYLSISLAYFAKYTSWRQHYLCGGTDQLSFIWFLNWWPFALRHGLNPFISKYVWQPSGFNLTWAASVPLAALAAAPITAIKGPVFAYNVLALLAPAMGAQCAFLLARDITKNWWASLAGGYIFGFSSYEFGQMQGHLNLVLTLFVPLGIWLCVLRFQHRLSARRFILFFTLLLVGQMGFYTEILASFCVLGFVVWVIFWLCAPASDRPKLWRLGVNIVVAASLTIVCTAPFIIYLIKGFAEVPAEVQPPDFFSADPVNYLIPTTLIRFGHVMFASVANAFSGNTSEQGAYLGLPLIWIMALYFTRNRKNPYSKALLATTLTLVLFSLGPWLHISGIVTKLPLPWYPFSKLPLLHSMLPTRFTMYVSLCAGLTAALWLSQAASKRQSVGRYAIAGLACFFLVPNRSQYQWSAWPEQPFFTAANINKTLGPMPNVLILPFSYLGPGMAWQVESKMNFVQVGGYLGFVPRSEQAWPIIFSLEGYGNDQNFNNDMAAYCDTHGVKFILIGPGTQASIAAAVKDLEWPMKEQKGIQIVSVPPSNKLIYWYVSGDYWPSASGLGWVGSKATIVTHGLPVSLTMVGNERPIRDTVHVSVSDGGNRAIYGVNENTFETITLAANAKFLLTADQTFVPDAIIHNGDQRALSVAIGIKPARQ